MTSTGSRSSARKGIRAVGLLISVVAVAAVVWWASKQQAPKLPSSFREIAFLVLAVLLYAVNTLVRGERWQRLLDRNGASAHRADSYGLTTVGYMGNNVL